MASITNLEDISYTLYDNSIYFTWFNTNNNYKNIYIQNSSTSK
jgi:hypothetical protein